MKALVTGGSSGLGFHIAKELRKRGYDLVLIARNKEKLSKAASKLHARWYSMDLAEEYREAGKIIAEAGPDVLVNNAGFGMYGEFREQSWEDVERMLRVNILALSHLTHSFLRVKKEGYILNVSSVAACRAQKKLSVYAGSKCYVAHFTKSLKKEIKGSMKISYLLLGPTKTNFFKNAGMPTKGFEKFMLSPEKVARYAVDKMFKGKTRIVPGIIYKLYCL